MKNDNGKLSKKTVRIIVILFVCSLFIAASFDLWGDRFLPSSANASESTQESLSLRMRNRHIDRMKPSVKLSENSVYTDEDIEQATALIKESFKKKDECVRLLRISFKEKEDADKNTMVFLCDYFVIRDFEAYERGLSPGWSVYLERDTENSEWKIVNQGYA